jgi:hypothetical protein
MRVSQTGEEALAEVLGLKMKVLATGKMLSLQPSRAATTGLAALLWLHQRALINGQRPVKTLHLLLRPTVLMEEETVSGVPSQVWHKVEAASGVQSKSLKRLLVLGVLRRPLRLLMMLGVQTTLGISIRATTTMAGEKWIIYNEASSFICLFIIGYLV